MKRANHSKWNKVKRNWQLYVMLLLPILQVLLFAYYPMLGLQIAFKDFKVTQGVWGSPWVGLKHFQRLFQSSQFYSIFWNTLILSFYNLAISFPFAILLAISMNYLRSHKFKKVMQMVTYAPHFFSTAVMVGLLMQILSFRTGIVNNVLVGLGLERINFMGKASYFRSIFVWSGIWQNAGYSSIIYISALAGVDTQLHEAAMLDGASKWKRVLHIDLPCIAPTIVIQFILSIGSILNVGYQKVLLMQNATNKQVSEVIDTFVYNSGIAAGLPNYSYTTAVGMFKSVICLILIVLANQISKKISDTSLL